MRGRRLRSAAVALTVCVGLALGGSVVGPLSPRPAFAATALTATLVANSGSVITPGEAFPVEFSVTNSGADIATSVTADVLIRAEPLQTLADAASWFRGDDTRADTIRVGTIDVGNVSPGDTVAISTTLTLDPNDLVSGWHVLGVQADIDNASSVTSVRSAVIWAAGEMPARASYATLLPLIAPATTSAFLDADSLTKLTGKDGLLARQLAAAPFVSAIGVDPRIVASIERLGDAAPATAQNWLTLLAAAPEPTFTLQYGDADPALQGQVGFTQLMPYSFEGITALTTERTNESWMPSLGHFVWAEPHTLTTAALTTILSRDDSADPATEENTAADDSPDSGAGSARTWLIAGSGNASVPEGSRAVVTREATPLAPSTSVDTLVLNDEFTAALRAAEVAASQAEWANRVTQAGAYLAIMASKGGGLLTGGFSRDLDARGELPRTMETLAYLRGLPWSAPQTLNVALDQPALTTSLSETPESRERLDGGSRVFAAYLTLQNFASAATAPSVVTGYAGRTLGPLLSFAVMTSPTTWSDDIDMATFSTRSYINDVHFGLTSNINMVGGQASIPITVVNGHSFDVTVTVHAVPSNPRVAVGDDQVVTIPADSQGTVKIPVAARVGNGDVNLTLTLASPNGGPIGDPVIVPVSVRADWEGFGLGIMATLFFALVITGTVRTIRRRRRGTETM